MQKSMEYKVSKFLFKVYKDNEICFFNSSTLKLLTGDKDDESYIDNFTNSKEHLQDPRFKILLDNGFLVEKSIDEEKNLRINKKTRMERSRQNKNRIGYMRISLTEKCNLKCKYCFVNTIYKNKVKNDMSEENFIKYMKWFINQNKNYSPVVQYFGGEPLLKMNLIKIGHELLKQAKEENIIRGFTEEIVTNGTLINDENADYFIKSKIDICVSIDGWKELNDKNRVFPNNTGSFDAVMKGINTYKRYGGQFKAIITPTYENLEFFDKIVEYLIKDLECTEISVNTPQPNEKGWEIDGNKMADAIKRAWEICDKMKIPFNAPGANIVFLVNNEMPQSFSCMNLTYGQDSNAFGIYVNSNGIVSNCVVECRDICSTEFEKFKMDDEYIDWHFLKEYKKGCTKCIAANICSGPCMIEHLICNGGFNVEKCKFYKSIVPWVLSK